MDYFKNLEQLIKINSYTLNKEGVDKVGLLMQGWLEELGFETLVHKREHIGDHLLFKSQRKEGLKNILLLGHNDTVFPPGYFEEYGEDEEYIYGPGACDMKGGNIIALEALRALYSKNGKLTNIDFLLLSDEETGSEDSSFLTSSIAKDYDYCLTFEAAGANYELVRSRNGVGRYNITIHGKAAHAGVAYEKGIDANLEAAYKIQELIALRNLDKGSLVNIGRVDGGIGINTVSPKCELLLEFRYQSNEEKDRLILGIEKILEHAYVKGSTTSYDAIIQRDVMQSFELQMQWLKTLEQITNLKILTEHRKGISDANIISSLGIPTFDGFGPVGDGDHTHNERALKASFNQRITMVTQILNFYQNKEMMNDYEI